MELKSYQTYVMDDIGAYLDALDTSKGLTAAWAKYWVRTAPFVVGGFPFCAFRGNAPTEVAPAH